MNCRAPPGLVWPGLPSYNSSLPCGAVAMQDGYAAVSSDGPGEYEVAFEVRRCTRWRRRIGTFVAAMHGGLLLFQSVADGAPCMPMRARSHAWHDPQPAQSHPRPQAFAGVAPQTLQPGTVAYIGTGGPVPEGADAGGWPGAAGVSRSVSGQGALLCATELVQLGLACGRP